MKYYLMLVWLAFLVACQPQTSNGQTTPPAVATVQDTVAQETEPKKEPLTSVEIPDAWVQVAMQHKNDTLPKREQMQFYNWLDSSWQQPPPDDGRYPAHPCEFQMEQVNLDEDEEKELVFHIDQPVMYGLVGVMDQKAGKWQLISLFNEDSPWGLERPFIEVNEEHKIFYCQWSDMHGSGFGGDHTYFYKLVNGEIEQCLGLLKSLSESGVHSPGRSIHTDFEFLENLVLKVTYDYELYGEIWYGKKGNKKSKDISFLKGADYVFYHWNADSAEYVLEIPPGSSLDKEKIESLEGEGSDKFIKAFRQEIAYMQQHGTPEQKKYWKKTVWAKIINE